jgi:LmbE family N-acetylglucosaminyl deacetylase
MEAEPVLLLAAHPDDEFVGAVALLSTFDRHVAT